MNLGTAKGSKGSSSSANTKPSSSAAKISQIGKKGKRMVDTSSSDSDRGHNSGMRGLKEVNSDNRLGKSTRKVKSGGGASNNAKDTFMEIDL